MRVILSRFFNESYLMEWWLRHHLEMFDHGILIDSNSNDESADMCRTLAPHWEVIRTEHAEYNAFMADFELMKHEERFPDASKIILNTTEFLVSPDLAALDRFLAEQDSVGAILPGAIMVDTTPELPPDPRQALIAQKTCGIWESDFDFKAAAMPGFVHPTRSRVYHRFRIGAYGPGRHYSHLPGQVGCDPRMAAIWWYGFSPWTEEFKSRKRQFASTFGAFDKRFGLGRQHYSHLDELDDQWRRIVRHSHPLVGNAAHERPSLARQGKRLARRIGGLGRRGWQRLFPR